MVSIITAVIANTNKIINENSVSERKRMKRKWRALERWMIQNNRSSFIKLCPIFYYVAMFVHKNRTKLHGSTGFCECEIKRKVDWKPPEWFSCCWTTAIVVIAAVDVWFDWTKSKLIICRPVARYLFVAKRKLNQIYSENKFRCFVPTWSFCQPLHIFPWPSTIQKNAFDYFMLIQSSRQTPCTHFYISSLAYEQEKSKLKIKYARKWRRKRM